MNMHTSRQLGFIPLIVIACLTILAEISFAFTLSAPADYTKDTLSVGSSYYLDRSYTIASQPAGFENFQAILTRNDDKNLTDAVHIQFSLPTSSNVYVAYDRRATTLPTWLQSFTATGQQIFSAGDVSMDYFNVYKKSLPPSVVTLGGNKCCGGVGASSNYIVYVEESDALAVSPNTLIVNPGEIVTVTITGGFPPYSFTENPSGKAIITLSGSVMTLEGQGTGDSDITVTDSVGTVADIDLKVWTNATLMVHQPTLTIGTGGIDYAAAGGGPLPYSVSSSDDTVATASINNKQITVQGISSGTATITVTDDIGDTDTIAVTVIPPLTASPTMLSMNPGDSDTITLSNGVGPFTAVSGNYDVATVSVSGNIVTVDALGPGTITVNIRDSLNTPVSVLVNVGGAGAATLGTCPMPPFSVGAARQPNILLILDHSGSMNTATTPSRWEIAKTVLMNILDQFPNVRFGLMRMDGSNFNGDDQLNGSPMRQGGKVLKPCGTPGGDIKTMINNWTVANVPQTWTNLAETLATAGQYFATVQSSGNRIGMGPAGLGYYEKNYFFPTNLDDATINDDDGNIINTLSPIQYYCQQSFIIFITDGLANYDNDWNVVTDVIGDYDGDGDSADCRNGDAGCSTADGGSVSSGRGEYFDDVAQFLYEHDMRSDLPGTQNLTTYVVGFQFDDALLSAAATKGGGEYYTPTDAASLTISLQDAILSIMDKISSGSAVATLSTSAQTDDYLIRARFLPLTFKGYLESYVYPYSAGDNPVWEAGDLLTTRVTARDIYTYMSTEGTPKQEFLSTNAALKTKLSADWGETAAETADIMNYIRGAYTYEGTKYRDRDGWALGDIIYSTPMVIGPAKFFHTENDYQIFKNEHAAMKIGGLSRKISRVRLRI